MKKTINYLFAAIVILAAASCQKETLVEPAEGISGSSRVISATFSDGALTKTTLDGTTPKWAAGDSVVFTDGTNILRVKLVASDPQEGQALITDGGAKFLVTIPGTWGSTIFAVYPSASFVPLSGGKIRFAIPYMQDGSFASANICVAKSTTSAIAFKNVVGIVKFTEVEDGIDYVSIPSDGICGTYELENPGDTPELVAGTGYRKTLVHTTGTEYYAAVPPVSIVANSWFLFEDVDNTIVGAKQTSQANTFAIGKLYNLGAVAKNSSIPEGMMRHAFTVSYDGKKCHFSRGNLYAKKTASYYDFGFAKEQYSFIGSASGNLSINAEGGVQVGDSLDYFTWVGKSSSLDQYGIVSDATLANFGTIVGEPVKKDWGEAFGPGSPWKTPLQPQIDILLDVRSTINNISNDTRFCKVKIDGKCGMLVFPDKFTWDTSTMGAGPNNVNARGTTWANVPTYTLEQFKAMENAGVVFFVVTGHRHPSQKQVKDINSKCGYWTAESRTSDTKAYNITINGTTNGANRGQADRYSGYCVRLISY